MIETAGQLVALDVGSKRIGVATAHPVARLAQPLATLEVDEHIMDKIKGLLEEQQATVVVVGLPRGLDGQETAQTKTTRQFGVELERLITIPLVWQDEALTSHISKAELQEKGGSYQKGQVDALAASYILEDYLSEHPAMEVAHG